MTTPMMLQWKQCKEKINEGILLFRLGDFYEGFEEDARILSRELELTLTHRQGIPMSGIPCLAIDKYLDRLIAKGYTVAIAEQVGEADGKGLVERKIVRFVSPATQLSDAILAEKSSQFLAAVFAKPPHFGLALIDLSTAEFMAGQYPTFEVLTRELARWAPKELLLTEPHVKFFKHTDIKKIVRPSWLFNEKTAESTLATHFRLASLDAFGFKEMPLAVSAAGAALIYLQGELSFSLAQCQRLKKLQNEELLEIDPTTLRHLDIFPTVFEYLDRTVTAMGGRELKRWLAAPLRRRSAILHRQEGVRALIPLLRPLHTALSGMRDIARLVTRIHHQTAGPRDLSALAISLKLLPAIKALLAEVTAPYVQEIEKRLFLFDALQEQLEKALNDPLPQRLSDGAVIRPGFSKELDEWREAKTKGHEWLTQYQESLRAQLGIKTLKVNFNKAFGYAIDVSRKEAPLLLGAGFYKRQTLVNNERFTSEPLKAFEARLLSAEAEIARIEKECYNTLVQAILAVASQLFETAGAIAELDALLALSHVATQKGYVAPHLTDDFDIEIIDGRHPILETRLPLGFIPNTLRMDGTARRFLLITGPNMGGKSTYIRQSALIILLAQIGSFVPAKEAKLGIVDKLFTRIGASDDLLRHQSTFMVEMIETANILHNASPRSFVVFDEIGRGTSTYDGIAIAWAVALALIDKGCKTLFATHYFELTDLDRESSAVKNISVAVEEQGHKIVLLHKIQEGAADKSYGLHVAALAGISPSILKIAQEKLNKLHKELTSCV